MRLYELLDRTYPWHKSSFQHGGQAYPTWSAEFKTRTGERYSVGIAPKRKADWVDVVFQLETGEDIRWDVTGTGDAYAVLATVGQIIRAYCDEIAPAEVRFSAKTDEGSRVKLYRKVVGMLDGYTCTERNMKKDVMFVLSKDQ